jgi:hypothetical protein
MAGRVLLPTACVPTHYALVIEPDHSTLEFTVEETIEVDVVEATTSVTLHSKEIHVRSVVFKGKGAAPVEIKATEISYNLTAVTVTRVLFLWGRALLRSNTRAFSMVL